MNGYVLSALLVFLTISMSANATENENRSMGMSQMPVFSDIDTNQDKLLSEEEFEYFQNARQELRESEGRMLKNSSHCHEMFERIDSDHNNVIDAKEFQSHHEMMRYSK
ncbi:hypothetical protein ABIS04_08860 [Shewanella sp. H8]|uniref:hypothetical protein n=1 Tax=Shewanella sp. H8 TaxID=3342676 RepID=UPI003315E47F